MAYVLGESSICVLLIALLGALLFSGTCLVLIARAIVRAALDAVASWARAQRQQPAALHYHQTEQALSTRRRELVASYVKRV